MKTYRHVNRVWTNPCCSCCEHILIAWRSEWCIKSADSPLLSLYNAPLKSRLSDHSLLSRRLHHSNTGMATPRPVAYTLRHQVRTLFTLSLLLPVSKSSCQSRTSHNTPQPLLYHDKPRCTLILSNSPRPLCVCLSRPLHNRKQRNTSRRRLLSAPNLMLSHCSSAPTARRASCSGGSGTSGGCGRPNCLSSLSRRSGMGAPAAVEGEGKGKV